MKTKFVCVNIFRSCTIKSKNMFEYSKLNLFKMEKEIQTRKTQCYKEY